MAYLSTLNIFNSCPIHEEPPETHKLGLTFAQLFKFLYSVKDWELRIEGRSDAFAYSDIAGYIAEAEIVNIINESSIFSQFSSSDDETLLTCTFWLPPTVSYYFDEYKEDFDSDTNLPPGDVLYVLANVQNRIGFSLVIIGDIYFYDNLYYVQVAGSLDIDLTANAYADHRTSFINEIHAKGKFLTKHLIPYAEPTVYEIEFDEDITIPFGVDYENEQEFDDGTGGTLDVDISFDITSITVKPKEYWEYDPGDGGGPVWEISSGAQLRNPFSISMKPGGIFYNPLA